MTRLADAVLPLIRTRADLHRRSAASAHGREMHEAIDVLEAALPTADPVDAYQVTHQALASATKVIARADDSSGIMGHACRRLLALHPSLAAAASVPSGRLIDWMIKFQFDDEVDYFTLDPVAYAPAFGEAGVALYRVRLQGIEAALGSRASGEGRWGSHSHDLFTLEWNAQRLAVLDRDIEAIIATHAMDRQVAAWLQDTAEAFEEIGEIGLALDWAKQATDFDFGHQSQSAADYWGTLLSEHRPQEAPDARMVAFRRWPSSTTAARLHDAAGTAWPDYRDEVVVTLAESPRDAVLFTLLTLGDVQFAWDLAHSLGLGDRGTWEELIKAYEKVDPLAVIPVHQELVENELVEAGAQHYRRAALRLAKMRGLASGSEQESAVEDVIADLRETHRLRPRLQQEFDRAGLP